MHYHFAFVAISVTMFGMAVGRADGLRTAGGVHDGERLNAPLAQASLGFAITIVASFLAHLWLPFRPELSLAGVPPCPHLRGALDSLHLQRHRRRAGAHAVSAAGQRAVCRRSGGRGGRCALLGPLLRVTDAPTAIVATAAVAAVAAVLFPTIAVPSAFRRKSRPPSISGRKPEATRRTALRGFRLQAEGTRRFAVLRCRSPCSSPHSPSSTPSPSATTRPGCGWSGSKGDTRRRRSSSGGTRFRASASSAIRRQDQAVRLGIQRHAAARADRARAAPRHRPRMPAPS